MKDPRFDALADLLVKYSTKVQPGENVMIAVSDAPEEITIALIRAVYAAGGYPFVHESRSRVARALMMGTDAERTRRSADIAAYEMRKMQCYIGVAGSNNVTETADVPSEKKATVEKLFFKPVHQDIRVKHTKWVGLRYPTRSMAQLAQMSTEAFEDFFFDVCTVDYAQMAEAMKPLVDLMEKTDRVRIVGPDTDLRFSIKDIPVIPCAGEMNIPDGEVFTAPVRDSVDGHIHYNAKTLFRGTVFEDVRFAFRNGKIVDATGSDTEKLNEILDVDDGARYIGEFAIGVNPLIEKPMLDTLFDEKISGSIHFTPGNAYEDEADNGNRSAIHWDIVLLQAASAGGGEIYFDDVLVRKDGLFVLDALDALNPDSMRTT